MWTLLILGVLVGSCCATAKSINDTVDALLALAKLQVPDYLPLPDLDKSLTLGFQLWRLRATNGRVGRLSTLFRVGEAAIERTDKEIALRVKFGLKELDAEYSYENTVLFGLFPVKGKASVECKNVEIDVGASIFKEGNKCSVSVTETSFETDLEECKITRSALHLIGLVSRRNTVRAFFERLVKNAISKQLTAHINAAIQGTQNMLCPMFLNRDDDDDDD